MKVKPYIISQLKSVPGLQKRTASTKGKATKLENFDRALQNSQVMLFQWDEVGGTYHKLQVNMKLLEVAMQENGGRDTFAAPNTGAPSNASDRAGSGEWLGAQQCTGRARPLRKRPARRSQPLAVKVAALEGRAGEVLQDEQGIQSDR